MRLEKNHILLLVPGFIADENDQTTLTYLKNLLRAMQNRSPRPKISLISFQFPFDKRAWNWNGVDMYYIGGSNSKFPLRLGTWNQVIKTAEAIDLEHEITKIHSFWLTECALVGGWISKKLNVPHFVTSMGQDALSKNHYFRWTSKWMNLSNIICMSAFHHKLLVSKTNIPISIIPFAIDKDHFPLINQERKIDILGVGSLTKLKNYELFIEVISTITDTHPNLKVKLVGDGPQYDSLVKLVSHKGLDEVVEFSGKLQNVKVLNLMNNSKVLLHTSTFEGMGYIFAEALYAGMKVVSTPVGIQKASLNWIVSDTIQGLSSGLVQHLENEKIMERFEIQPMEQTIQSYFNLWEGLDE